ncbi:ATP-binding protein [Gloeobacter kilaueensis]|uniref:histidine kinase n=1 Tax=Gloeobacter kilaueensis (strain ATCC BAA-2537 / CCAP 1431/1 / ULC 316 / JS1) TaxID=1183438 RepID=U5QNL9_GLOK1|nr:ATP-binding protein [Gloeobacter kilaueensis]AGY59194.1 histidine kinase [Gloeobacter kilaueensis JS1]
MLHDPEQLELFPKLSDDEVQRLAAHGRPVEFAPGELLFKEGDPACHFYVVLEGQVQITKRIHGKEKILITHGAGEFTGDLPMFVSGTATVTARAIVPSRVLEIELAAFRQALADCSPGAASILTAMAARAQDLETQLRHQEKLAALGKLSAGLAHELNNPAAAGRRAAQQLREALLAVQSRMLDVCEGLFPPPQRLLLVELQQQALAHRLGAPRLAPLEQSDREDALADWLADHEIADGWKLAPTLVTSGIGPDQLAPLADQLPGLAFPEALRWLSETLSLTGLVDEVEQSTARISQLVKAIKSYTYMDQAPLQEVDVHEGIENTLTILHHKLKYGVTIVREYAEDLPRLCAYGSELNQVWTNLIDNAIDAMNGKGQITIRTSLYPDTVLVELIDTGSGIPPDIQPRIFEPFFTTKGVGQGSGLGLDIVRRIVAHHRGSIRVESQPGHTRFKVCLPIRQP